MRKTIKVQKLKLGNIFICTLSDQTKRGGVFAGVSCGASNTWRCAKHKALSEYVERNACSGSTNGFAAFPFFFRKERAQRKANEHALLERTERYAWHEWFYNTHIFYELQSKIDSIFYEEICREIPISQFYAIYPRLETGLKMAILYALTDSGLVCGGAVRKEQSSAEENALKELYMHAVGLYRMRKESISATTDYEKRLMWISTQQGLLEKRLAQSGKQAISIPFTVSFQSIPTKFRFYVVQRCLFNGYNREFISAENELYI